MPMASNGLTSAGSGSASIDWAGRWTAGRATIGWGWGRRVPEERHRVLVPLNPDAAEDLTTDYTTPTDALACGRVACGTGGGI